MLRCPERWEKGGKALLAVVAALLVAAVAFPASASNCAAAADGTAGTCASDASTFGVASNLLMTAQLLLVASDVTEQRAADQARLQAAIQQREVLVREVHHRIKNNLQGVAGLLQQIAARKPMMMVPSYLAERVRRIKMARKIKAAVEQIEEDDKRFVLAELSKDGALPEAIECGGEKVADIRRGGRKQLDQASLRAADPVLFEAHCKRIEWNELRPTKTLPLMPIQDVVQIEQDQ